MNTRPLASLTNTFSANYLTSDYHDLDDYCLLLYYQHRDNVRFFSVADPVETQPPRIRAVLDNRFEFTGETHRLPEPIDWLRNPSEDIEWHILLHKFYYATGLGMQYRKSGDPAYLQKWVTLTQSWIEQTPVGFISADVTGRRVQNWIYAWYHFVHQQPDTSVPADFHRKFLESLHAQVDYLCDNLHPARNHRTLELYAIFLAAVVFPEFRRASDWLQFSLQKIIDNINTDLLDDGVQCELSTDYHHIVLRNYLCIRRLARLNNIEFPQHADDRLIQALEFSLHVHRPDGIVPSLSDGDARPYTELLRQGANLYGREDMLFVASAGTQGKPPEQRARSFPCSGYHILRSDWAAANETYQDARYLVFDCGPLGDGNHGHLDALSIELAAWGRSLVVDPGRYTYCETGDTNWRVTFRSTAWHNTIEVDGLNQTRYLPGKKKYKIQGPEPQTTLLLQSHETDLDVIAGRTVSAEYDAIHERCLLFVDQQYWICIDRMSADTAHRYALRFHLNDFAQGRTSTASIENGYLVSSPGLLLLSADRAPQIDAGFVSRLYGQKLPAPVIRYSAQARNTCFQTVLFPCKNARPSLGLSTFRATSAEPDQPQQAITGLVIHHHDRGYQDWCLVTPGLRTAHWRFGNRAFRGQFLFMRIDASGNIKKLHMNTGATYYQY